MATYKPKTPWIEFAKKLKCGRKMRIQCCAKDTSMLISHDERGYAAHCFRCNDSDFVAHGERSIKAILKAQKEIIDNVGVNLRLPHDFTKDVPVHYGLWWHKYGISAELAHEYGWGYSEYQQRLILPVWDGNELVAIQGRAVFDWQRPKYLNPTGPKVSSAIFYSTRNGDFKSESIVVVEDIISAARVGKVSIAASILGTNLSTERINSLVLRSRKIYLWFDNDKAGTVGFRKAMRKLLMQGVQVFRITSDKDPKYYNNEQIIKFIDNAQEIK